MSLNPIHTPQGDSQTIYPWICYISRHYRDGFFSNRHRSVIGLLGKGGNIVIT